MAKRRSGPGTVTPPDRSNPEPDGQVDEDQVDEDGEEEATPPSALGHPTVKDAGGFVLGIMLWGWVILPYLAGGVPRVRDVWRAKFLNKGPKGEFLP